jgi:hypothetical protein
MHIDLTHVFAAGSPNTSRASNKLTGGAAGTHANGEGIVHGEELPHLQPRFGQDFEAKTHIGGHMELDLSKETDDV